MNSPSSIGAKARIPNPALKPLEFLIGEWRTTGSHPQVAQTLSGRTSFEWHEGGAFLIMHAQIDDPLFPDGMAIIGSDDKGNFAMTYFDERGVSRLYEVTVGRGMMTWTRDDAKLSQTMTITAQSDGNTMVSTGQMSEERGAWTPDLSQVFKRAR